MFTKLKDPISIKGSMYKGENMTSDAAKTILQYWYTLNFLEQEAYPVQRFRDCHKQKIKYENDLKNNEIEEKYKKSDIVEMVRDDIKKLSAGAVRSVIKYELRKFDFSECSDVTVYLGCFSREACLNETARALGTVINEASHPERSADSICLAALQLKPDGEYVEHSISVSPVLWAISRITSNKDCDDKLRLLSHDTYKSDMDKLERKYYSQTDDKTLWDLTKIYEDLRSAYGSCITGGDAKDEFIFSFRIYKDEIVKAKKDDDTYLGLSKSFYTSDLELAADAYNCGNLKPELISYLNILNTEDENKCGRADLVNSDGKTLLKIFDSILDIKNAPPGKWPSEFMPALMQETAINLEIKRDGPAGNVFSVNGPPGTGKSTLLKEIVVNNIVERARLLSAYDLPDDAFESHKFINGKEKNNQYSANVSNWYTLKNDRINDYGILVTSCNNAAVENITKELPVDSFSRKDEPGKKNAQTGKKPPTDEKTKTKSYNGYEEVRKMFAVKDTQFSLKVKAQNKEFVEKPDVYFSQYATNLISSTEKVVPAWGLVAAALGKKSNISDFYFKALSNIIFDQYNSKNTDMESRKKEYLKIRELFTAQLDKVEDMRRQMSSDIDKMKKIESSYTAAKKKLESGFFEKDESELHKQNESLNDQRSLYEQSTDKYKKAISDAKDKACECDAKLSALEQETRDAKKELAELNRKKAELLEQALTPGITGFIKKLFCSKGTSADRHALMKQYESMISQLSEDIQEKKNAADDLTAQINKLSEEISDAQKNLELSEINTEKLSKQKADNNSALQKLLNQKKECEQTVSVYNEYSISKLPEELFYKKADSELIAQIQSRDKNKSTKAQLVNPWLTKAYDTQREKLFFYAMQLHKSFVLASGSCRDNLRSLSQYWKLLADTGKKSITFDKNEALEIVPALFQTLFLVVPVISSTFASIGRMFQDVRKQDTIGTLIVDEAGQASPECLVGALFRSRRAMIVGDPKQVEPVVTDELDLLKYSFKDEVLARYRDKSLSVQNFADRMNKFGTYLNGENDEPEWIGCPLLVHRRCISPMYDISNSVSYDGFMKQQTEQPKEKDEKNFVYDSSRWIDVKGRETGNKDHYVSAQSKAVFEIVRTAFKNINAVCEQVTQSDNEEDVKINRVPKVYIISPFKSVVAGITKALEYEYKKWDIDIDEKDFDIFLRRNIGTVHTFQGKETFEVIFLLGCDESSEGAVKWVNSNIVNVAVTRAKFRLYIVGDRSEKVWQKNTYLKRAMEIIDQMS
ncbi:MAG: AAA domain-containing protein [Oscillospiraceae bacterium]|nr:AAA domain-containing protein [Oscillospiraceae bacterium]